MTKTRIALIVSLMFSAPAAVIALEQSATLEAAQPEAVATESTELQSATLEPAAPLEPAAVSTEPAQTESVAVVVIDEPTPAPRAHTTPRRADRTPSLGAGGPEDWDRPMLPGQMAYFDRLEQQRGQLIARHDAFPGAAYEDRAPLPSTVAYFDRAEQQRFASAQPASTVARSDVRARSSDEATRASSAEVAMTDTSAIR